MSSKKQIAIARAGLGFLILALTLWTGNPHAAAGHPDALQRNTVPASGADLKYSPEDAWRAYSKLPIAFVENRGQTDSRVRYYAQGNRYAFFLTSRDIVLSFSDAASREISSRSSLRFVGGKHGAAPEGVERVPGERQLSARQRSRRLADRAAQVRTDRLPRAVAGHRPAAARRGRDTQVRVPSPARRRPGEHPARLRRRERSVGRCIRRAAASTPRWAC